MFRRAGRPLILQLRFCIHLIVLEHHITRTILDSYPNQLFAFLRRASVTNDVIAEYQIPGFTTNPDAGSIALAAVVLNYVLLDPIAVTGHSHRFIAEKDPILAIPANLVLLQ
jgi:hypothetical protein